MSKRKTHDLHDIIDTAFVAADYSHGNGYYDKAMDHDTIRRHRGFGQPRGNLQEPYKFGSAINNDSFRNDGGNIFLKNSQNNSNNTNNTNSTNNEKSELSKIVLNDDNFPSLGTKSTKINNPSTVENKLDFKKIVEKKQEVVNKPEPKINNSHYKKFNYNQYSLYQEVKEKSEMIAHLKMVDDVSSDDNLDDNYY